MQVQCPECGTRYLVKPESIGVSGRRVKCARCEHVWKEFPQKDTEQDTTPPPQSEQIAEFEKELQATHRTPAKKKESKVPVREGHFETPISLKIAAFVVGTGVLCSGFVAHQPTLRNLPVLSSIYHAFGMSDTNGLILRDLSVSAMPAKGKDVYYVNGVIENTTDHNFDLPILRVVLSDMENITIEKEEFTKKDVQLPAGEKLPFESQVSTKSKDVAKITVDIGSPFELMMRD